MSAETGTGKTLAILCSLLAFKKKHPNELS